MAVRAFLFDIGNVLVDFDLDALAATVAGGDPEAMARLHALRRHESLRQVETGAISDVEYFDRHVRPLVPALSYRDWVRAWRDNFTRNPDGAALFAELRRAGRPVYLLSNIAPFNAQAIEEKFPGFFASSSGNFLSFDMGCVKPEPEAYLRALAGMKVAPEECLFLDERGVRGGGAPCGHPGVAVLAGTGR